MPCRHPGISGRKSRRIQLARDIISELNDSHRFSAGKVDGKSEIRDLMFEWATDINGNVRRILWRARGKRIIEVSCIHEDASVSPSRNQNPLPACNQRCRCYFVKNRRQFLREDVGKMQQHI